MRPRVILEPHPGEPAHVPTIGPLGSDRDCTVERGERRAGLPRGKERPAAAEQGLERGRVARDLGIEDRERSLRIAGPQERSTQGEPKVAILRCPRESRFEVGDRGPRIARSQMRPGASGEQIGSLGCSPKGRGEIRHRSGRVAEPDPRPGAGRARARIVGPEVQEGIEIGAGGLERTGAPQQRGAGRERVGPGGIGERRAGEEAVTGGAGRRRVGSPNAAAGEIGIDRRACRRGGTRAGGQTSTRPSGQEERSAVSPKGSPRS